MVYHEDLFDSHHYWGRKKHSVALPDNASTDALQWNFPDPQWPFSHCSGWICSYLDMCLPMLALGYLQAFNPGPVRSLHAQELHSLCCYGWKLLFIVLFMKLTVTLSISLTFQPPSPYPFLPETKGSFSSDYISRNLRISWLLCLLCFFFITGLFYEARVNRHSADLSITSSLWTSPPAHDQLIFQSCSTKLSFCFILTNSHRAYLFSGIKGTLV